MYGLFITLALMCLCIEIYYFGDSGENVRSENTMLRQHCVILPSPTGHSCFRRYWSQDYGLSYEPDKSIAVDGCLPLVEKESLIIWGTVTQCVCV